MREEVEPYVRFAVFDTGTDLMMRTGTDRRDRIASQVNLEKHPSWVVLEGDFPVGTVWNGGKPKPGPDAPPVATTSIDVKREAQRRITARYPLGKQNTIMLRGGDERDAMHAFIERVIAASHVLEAMTLIPPDFANDRHWGAL